MGFHSIILVAVAACAVTMAIDIGQVSISMCNWQQFRANIIQDTIYLDGGILFWREGLVGVAYPNNSLIVPTYGLNLGQPFDNSTDLSTLFNSMSIPSSSASNGILPNYYDGTMFANDEEFLLYGGLTALTNSTIPPDSDQILGYEAYQYGPYRSLWQAGFVDEVLLNVTRYITNGAGVSAPSENLGFYFSGMRAADWGIIQSGDTSASTLANTLITANMTVMRSTTWENDTIPDGIQPRANAELVWIPVSESGILIAIGGVIDPEVLATGGVLNSSQIAASDQTSPTFMKTLPVYNVATKQWFTQNTTGDIPPQLTLFCSVVAAAADGSSYNIYIYGGYDGINVNSTTDDVYILSVPSFTWIKAHSGTPSHSRSGHKCVKVYPDQMFVLGGVYQGDLSQCVSGGIIQVFNLNTLEFQNSYDPRMYQQYQVPSLVTAQIGGNANGSATKTAPSSWNNNTLTGIFQSKYTKTIATFYPYQPVSTSGNSSIPNASIIPNPQNGGVGNGIPGWAGAIIGVLVGVSVITACLVGWFFCRHRRPSDGYGPGSYSSNNNRSRIRKWLVGASKPPMSDISVPPSTPGYDVTERPPTDLDGTASVTSTSSPLPGPQEAGSLTVHELEQGDKRFELPTDFNMQSSSQISRRPRTSDVSSIDEMVLGTPQRPNNSNTDTDVASVSRRASHRHQGSGTSVSLPDISEDTSEDMSRERYASDITILSPGASPTPDSKMDRNEK